MPKVDSSYFGSIIIDGKKFNSDVIVSWNGEIKERQSSHDFTKSEFQDILMRDPEIVVIGTGTAGLMKVDPSIEVLAKVEGIELIARQTPQATEEFNKYAKRKKVVAIFHVTC